MAYRMTRLRKFLLLLPVAMLGGMLACTPAGPTGPTAKGPSGPRAVTLKEWAIEPKELTAKAGSVTFEVKNAGNIEHNFVVEGVGQIDSLLAGQTKSLQVSVQPGTYSVICSLPGHKEAGMTGRLTVTS